MDLPEQAQAVPSQAANLPMVAIRQREAVARAESQPKGQSPPKSLPQRQRALDEREMRYDPSRKPQRNNAQIPSPVRQAALRPGAEKQRGQEGKRNARGRLHVKRNAQTQPRAHESTRGKSPSETSHREEQ